MLEFPTQKQTMNLHSFSLLFYLLWDFSNFIDLDLAQIFAWMNVLTSNCASFNFIKFLALSVSLIYSFSQLPFEVTGIFWALD